MAKKIILVIFPPIINFFNFHSQADEWFGESGNLKKIFLQKKTTEVRVQRDLLDLIDIDYSDKVSEIIKQRTENTLVLINYPHTKKHFKSLTKELSAVGQKINNIILLNISNYELITDIQSEYLICPICEKVRPKEELVENKEFVCLNDIEYRFSLDEINKFNDHVISYYLKNSKELIEEFLQNNNDSSSIFQLTIKEKSEIFSGETEKKLLEIIKSSIK